MTTLSRWLAPAVLAAGLGFGAMTPTPVQAQDVLSRVLVDVADVIFNNGVPYYRYGNQRYDDRLIVSRDRYGRPIYYRQVPYGNNYGGRVTYDQYGRRIYDQYGRRINYPPRYDNGHRYGPPYGNAYGYRNAKCNKHGKCKTEYYSQRHDHDRDDYNRNDHDRGDHDRGRHDRDDD